MLASSRNGGWPDRGLRTDPLGQGHCFRIAPRRSPQQHNWLIYVDSLAFGRRASTFAPVDACDGRMPSPPVGGSCVRAMGCMASPLWPLSMRRSSGIAGFPATHFFRPTPRRTSPAFSGLPAARPTASPRFGPMHVNGASISCATMARSGSFLRESAPSRLASSTGAKAKPRRGMKSAWRDEARARGRAGRGVGGARGRCPTGCRTEKVCGGIDPS